MSYTVWRWKNDGRLEGYCDAEYTGFEPGGDLAAYVLTIEPTAPPLPPAPPSRARTKLLEALADSAVPATVKSVLRELIP